MDFCVTAGKEPQPAESWPEVFPKNRMFSFALGKHKEAESADGEYEMPVVKKPHRRPSQICESMLTRISRVQPAARQ